MHNSSSFSFVNILNSNFLYIELICILLKSYWKRAFVGGSFAYLWVVLVEVWLFEGWSSLINRFQDNNVPLHLLRLVLIRSFQYAYCCEATEIALLLMVLLLDYELYWSSYDLLKVSWVSKDDLKTLIYFCTLWGQLWYDHLDWHIVWHILK